MKKAKKGTAYTSIKNTLRKLGVSTEDSKGIINYIKFIVSNSVTEEKSTPAKVSVTSIKKGTGLDKIIAALASHPNEMYDIERISAESGVSIKTLRTYIRQLRNSRKVKLVGCDMGKVGPAKLLYQGYNSPLKALKTVTREQGFDSICNFIKNHKELVGNSITPSAFTFVVEKAGLEVHPLLLSTGITRGYRNTELKKLAKETYRKPEVQKRTYNKKTTTSKRSYTRKVQPSKIATSVSTKKGGNFISKFFRSKKSSSDLIKF